MDTDYRKDTHSTTDALEITEKARIQRITEMESRLDLAAAAISKLSDALAVYEDIQDSYFALENYYGSTEWREDFEADEAGKLPEDLKRGVLSEDAVYNLIQDHHELMEHMQNIVQKNSI